MTIDIRTYQSDDAEAVCHLAIRAWAPVFASLEAALGSGLFQRMHTDWRADQRAAVTSALDCPDTPVRVAVLDNVVVGFLALRLDTEASTGEIHMIAVDPDHQGRGIGGALTRHALSWFAEQHMSIAMVETGGDPGHAPARRLYERAGFTMLPIARYFTALD